MRVDHAGPPRPSRRRARRAVATRRRTLTLLAPAVIVAVGLWALAGYSAVVDVRIVVLEAVATAVCTGAALWARSSHARLALALVSAYIGLTLLGDAYWLLSVDPTGLSYTLGEVEPGFTVTVEIVRYLALAALLAHASPRGRTDGAGLDPTRRRRPGPDRWNDRAAFVQVQATAGTAALVLLCTPAGALVGEGKAYSVFTFFDVVLTATAVAAVLRAVGSPPRPSPARLRLLVRTAIGTTGLVLGDAVMVLSQTRAWTLGAGVGLVLAVGGAAVLVATHLHASPTAPVPVSAVPPAPARPRPRLAVAVTVLVQHVLPLLVTVLTTVQVVTATTGADPTVRVEAATVGTAAAAVLLSLLGATARARRAHRDEHDAAASDRDELTGAYSRRGFTALVHRTITDGPGEEPGEGSGWSVALLDLDGFKAVNDTFGHDAGDRVLTTAARRAAGVLEGRGVLARFGGDEFVALLSAGPTGVEATALLVEQLEEAITTPVRLGNGSSVGVGVSIGVADIAHPAGADDLTAALKLADERMYARKQSDRADHGGGSASERQ